MLDELEKIDNQFDYEKPFVLGYCMDGDVTSSELLDAHLMKRLMMEQWCFVIIFDDDIYSVSHDWSCGGIFGSFIIQHHNLNEPGETICQLNICDYYPSLADLLLGETNAYQEIADVIIEMFHEESSLMKKYRKDIVFFKGLLEQNKTLCDDMRSLFEAVGID